MIPTKHLSRFAAALTGVAALIAPAAAQPALWKVQGPHATVYLFGTVHTLHAGAVWRSPGIDAAFEGATTLYEELENTGDQSALQPLVAKYGFDPSHPLSGKLDDAGKARLSTVAEKLGAPVEQLDRLRPWMAAVGLSTLAAAKAGYDPNSAVDLQLKQQAAEHGKTVAGLETMEQQIRDLAGLPEPVQIQFLLSALEEAERGSTLLDQVVAAWTAGDLERLRVLTTDNLKLKYPELYQRIFVERNRRFAARIEDLLKGDGVYFVAIGAGHLVGPDSVQADLAGHGAIITRM